MPEQYNKIAEGIVKGNVPMVASFVERYVSDDEPGFFVGDREHVEGDIRVHVTVFGYLEQPDSGLTDSAQLGVVDLQQLPDGRVWMVIGVLPAVADGEAWLNDVYSGMVRRMAARLVQFGFLDAPNRPRLKAAAHTLTQVAQALTPPKHAVTPEPLRHAPAPAAPVAEPPPVAPRPATPRPTEPPPQPVPIAPSAPAIPVAQAAPPMISHPAPSPVPLAAAQVSSPPSSSLFGAVGDQRVDLALTVVMVLIWAIACSVLVYLAILLAPLLK